MKAVQPLQSALAESSIDEDIEETFSIIMTAIKADDWDKVKYLLDDLTLLINTDTGGQAEFLDLQSSLVQGPSFNLLFSRLIDELHSMFQACFTNKEGISTEKEDSTLTVAEVLFQALSSIACFSGCFCNDDTMPQSETSVREVSTSQSYVCGHVSRQGRQRNL